jgi:hypothetical protein
MSTILYFITTALIGVGTWLILHAAWKERLNPVLIVAIAVGIALVWPLVLVGILTVSILIFINKPRKS